MIYQLKSNTALKKTQQKLRQKSKKPKNTTIEKTGHRGVRLESVQPFDKKKPRNTHHKTSDREKLIDA